MIRSKQPRLLNIKHTSNTKKATHASSYSENTLEESRFLPKDAVYFSWAAMIFSIIIWFKFDSGLQAGELGNTRNFYRMFLVAAGGILALHHLLKNTHRIKVALTPPLLFLLLYGFVALFSSLLVPTNSFYTMWKSIEIIIDVTAIVSIIAYAQSPYGPINAYKWLMAYNAMMLIFIVAGAIITPDESFRSSRGIIPVFLQGSFPVSNPNSVGFISVQLVIHNIAIMCRAPSKTYKIIALIIACISFIALILAQSRTSTAGLIAGLIVYLYLDKKKFMALSLMVVGALIMLYTSGADLVTGYLQRGQSEELMTSLSGRTHGWTAAWEMFQQSPWIGHGFAAAARTEILGTENASTLHGALFDVIVGVGLIGLIPWLLAILGALKAMTVLTLRMSSWVRNKYERSIHAEFSAITAILVIRSATSSGTAMHEHAFMLLLCIIGYSYMMLRFIKNR